MKLYGADVCPFVHRVRLTLAVKGLEHEYVSVDLKDKPDWYHEVLPSGKVPLLEHNGHRIWESAIVCEYLEEAFPQKALFPKDPGERAKARIWIDWVSSSLIPPFYKYLKAQEDEEQAEHKETVLNTLEKLENEGFQDSEWIFGDSLSLVDIETYPWFERWPVLSHYRGFEVPERFEKVRRWMTLMEEREEVRAIAMKASFYIEQYTHYAKPKEAAKA
jgi:glutathione S-transferase